jgi:hypothetical protein
VVFGVGNFRGGCTVAGGGAGSGTGADNVGVDTRGRRRIVGSSGARGEGERAAGKKQYEERQRRPQPQKDPALVTLQVLPYDDPRAGDCSRNRRRLKAPTSGERGPGKAPFHRQAALRGRENRNAFARLVVETQDMKKRLFIILLVIAALLLAGLGTIIGTGGD